MALTAGLNFVSRLRASQLAFPEHEGPLSIKCVFKGQEMYEVEGARRIVDPTSYLILNHQQRYASIIASDQEVESFCIWFRPAFAEQVLASLCTPADRLLDEPGIRSRSPITFFDRLYPQDRLVSPVISCMHAAFNEGWSTRPWLEEQFHLLLERMLQAHRNVYREVERVPAVRHSTRVELYRRLHRAKDFMDASLGTQSTLAELATVAYLSPHHFLRVFKHVFHETPHQYQSRKRMEKARDLLARTDQQVTEICFGVGFESLGSFSWEFRRRFGVSPSQYRIQRRNRLPEKSILEEAHSAPV